MAIYESAEGLPERVVSYREKFREQNIGRSYKGWAHFAFTSVGAGAAIVAAAMQIHDVQPLQWLAIPISFFIANLAEYWGHRAPMHRPMRPLEILYRRHTLEHHHFFTHESMVFESARDFKITLFPPAMLIFFLGLLATPIAAGLYFVAGPNVGWLFATVAVSYFLTYEWLHFAYHLSPDSLVGRTALVKVLRRAHTTHHDLAQMGRKNFNITFPICDVIFGTYLKRPER